MASNHSSKSSGRPRTIYEAVVNSDGTIVAIKQEEEEEEAPYVNPPVPAPESTNDAPFVPYHLVVEAQRRLAELEPELEGWATARERDAIAAKVMMQVIDMDIRLKYHQDEMKLYIAKTKHLPTN